MIRSRRILTAIAVAAAVLGMSAPHAFAYNGTAAANYAEQYALNYNPYYLSFSADCTNFWSQAMKAGLFPSWNAFNQTGDNAWWYEEDMYPYSYTATWNQVVNNWDFLINYANNPGGWLQASYYAPPKWANDGLSLGDPIYYDWNSDYVKDHIGIDASYGYDAYNSAYYGDLVDYHTNNRKYAHWELRYENAQYNTTTIYLVHIR